MDSMDSSLVGVSQVQGLVSMVKLLHYL